MSDTHQHCYHRREQIIGMLGVVVWWECCDPPCDWSSYTKPTELVVTEMAQSMREQEQ